MPKHNSEDASLYNSVKVKNIYKKDFSFKVAGEEYLIEAGTTMMFPKFMVRPLVKHLIDRIILEKDPTGRSLRNGKMRAELAAQIVIEEKAFAKPRVPSNRELVNGMNESDMDSVLRKSRKSTRLDEDDFDEEDEETPTKSAVLSRLKANQPKNDTRKSGAKKPGRVVPTKVEDDEDEEETEDVEEEVFDQIETEKEEGEESEPVMPTREEMLKFATDELKMDIEHDETKKAFEKLTDEQLYDELGIRDYQEE